MDSSKWVAEHSLIKEVCDEMNANDADTLKKMANVTTRFGWNLNKATICAQKGKQHVGVYAGDAETFADMAPVFDKAIMDYHGVDVEKNVANAETFADMAPVFDKVIMDYH